MLVAALGIVPLTGWVVLGKIRSVTRSDTKNGPPNENSEMPDLTLDFTWFKDPKGYRLVPAKLPRRPGQSINDVPMRDIEPARVVRNRGALQSYRPLEHFPALFDRFINTATSETGVLEFIKNFGPLTHDGLGGKGDVVPNIIDQARAMAGGPGTALVKKLNASITVERDGVRLKLWPACLLDALWLQLAQANAISKQCPQCRKPFRIGVAVNRRKDARFCSDDCRIKFNSLERSR